MTAGFSGLNNTSRLMEYYGSRGGKTNKQTRARIWEEEFKNSSSKETWTHIYEFMSSA